MRQLLIGDCHFGKHSNSVTWLETQLKFFNTQFVEVLDNKNINRVVFLGDLFDIRYSVNQQVGLEVKKLLRKLFIKYNNIEFFFISGNHDYYSPLEEFHAYNIYDLIFGEEFTKYYTNVKFIVDEPLFDHNNLYLPWYYAENFNHFSETFYSIEENIENVFCHADLTGWDYSRTTLLKNAKVWSGHIHGIVEDYERNLYNIGAMFSFDYNDVNMIKYMYILDGNNLVEKIENITTPRFKRFFNEDIFTLTDEDFENSFVSLCIYSSNINKIKYIERLKEIKIKYDNVRKEVIDNNSGETVQLSYFNANIDQYIENNVPEYLNDKYERIKKIINNRD